MFRTRLAAVVLSGGLALVSGCMQLPQGPGLFSRLRGDPCCNPPQCGCSSGTMLSQGPYVMPQDQIPVMPSQTMPPPTFKVDPNSPNRPFTP